jgi:flagellar hook protein FlgE
LTANLPSTASPVAPANLPSTNSPGSTYTDATSLVVYDNLGGSHTINLYFTDTGSNTWEVDAFDASNASPSAGFPYSSGPLATQTLTFNPTTGALSSGSPLSFPVPNGQLVNLDLSNMTQLAAGFNVTAATANGNAPSGISGVSISTGGSMMFNYANGTSTVAYDIPLANVVSRDNLASVNGSAYLPTASSGPVYLGTAGGAGFGKIEASSLESSTVDLATELTDMIQAQSAYEANSKVFQTGANILDVLNGLKP